MSDDDQRRLLEVRAELAKATARQIQLQAEHDRLLRELTDLAGASDQRFAGPR